MKTKRYEKRWKELTERTGRVEVPRNARHSQSASLPSSSVRHRSDLPARVNCFTNPKSIRAWIKSEFGSEMAKDQWPLAWLESFQVSEFLVYTRKSSNHSRQSSTFGQQNSLPSGAVDVPEMMWQIFCKCVVIGWSGELALPAKSWIMCNTFTCHNHQDTIFTQRMILHCRLQNLQFAPLVCFQTK